MECAVVEAGAREAAGARSSVRFFPETVQDMFYDTTVLP